MYDTPSPEELRAFMIKKNLTGADIAALSGVAPRSARQWVQAKNTKGARAIPWAAWAIIQILTGEKSKGDYIKLVDEWKKERMGIRLFERGKRGRRPPEDEQKGGFSKKAHAPTPLE